MLWRDANEYCLATYGSTLATIRNEEEELVAESLCVKRRSKGRGIRMDRVGMGRLRDTQVEQRLYTFSIFVFNNSG